MTKSPTRSIAALAAVFIAIGLSVHASLLAVADSAVAESSALLEGAWRKAPPPLVEWIRVRNGLLLAQRMAPSDPAIFEILGVLHARRAASSEFLTYARDYYIQSLSLRPTSPYTWTNFAETKYLLGETGQLFERALGTAIDLGPWEPLVQLPVIDVGLAVYGEVPVALRTQIDSIVSFGMRRNSLEILQIARRRGRLDVACRYASASPRLTDAQRAEFCKGSQQ